MNMESALLEFQPEIQVDFELTLTSWLKPRDGRILKVPTLGPRHSMLRIQEGPHRCPHAKRRQFFAHQRELAFRPKAWFVPCLKKKSLKLENC